MVDRRLQRPIASTVGTCLFLLWGLVGWGLQFSASYLAHTWLCTIGASEGAIDLALVGLMLLALAAIAPVALMPGRIARAARLSAVHTDDTHLIMIARTVALLSILAVLWTGLGVVVVETCVLGR